MLEFPGSAPSRRDVLKAGLCAALCHVAPITAATLAPSLQQSLQRTFAEREVREGKVTLSLPPLAENGNSVALSVDVDNPMTKHSYVRTVHVFSERNPLPDVARFHFSPLAGRAHVATRIRLADSQIVLAAAELSDGSIWTGAAEIVVTLAACVDLS